MRFQYQSVRIAITPADASTVAIMHYLTLGRGDVLPPGATWFARDAGIWARPVTDALVREQIERAYLGNERPMPLSWVVLPDDAALPEDRSYRAAWRHDGAAIVHDMPHARELHRERLREARAPQLAALDIDTMRADEVGDAAKKAAAVKAKQALRDVTKHPAIDDAKTVAELKTITLGLL